MNKSAPILTRLSGKTAPHPIRDGLLSSFPACSLFLGIILVANLLPWVVLKDASLTLGAYDLAEWSSLHPLVRASNPPFMISLFLRLPIPLTVIILATSSTKSITQRKLKALLIVLLSASLMPPLEFFRQAGGDPNFRQQFGLSIGTLLVATGIYFLQNTDYRALVSLLVALIVTICGMWGWSQSYQLLRDFQLNPDVGWGALLFVITYIIFLLVMIYDYVNKIR